MLMAERHHRILAMLRQRGVVSIREFVGELGTSEVTLRRDLRELAAEGLLRRTHGGARFPTLFGQEPTYQEKTAIAIAEKEAIAGAAAAMISSGEVIGLGAGTTTEALARRLTHLHNLTVITNSLIVAQTLGAAPDVAVFLSGGALRVVSQSLIGGIAEHGLHQLHVSTLFISGNGLTAKRGLSTPVVGAAGVDRQLAQIAERIVVLVDHTKIGREMMVQTVPISDIDHVITDSGTEPADVERLRAAGVELTIARMNHMDGAPSQR